MTVEIRHNNQEIWTASDFLNLWFNNDRQHWRQNRCYAL